MINSRDIQHLDPEARNICLKHVIACRNQGIEIIVTSTWRDFEAQDDLYAIGRTKERQRRAVTNAKGGRSWHNYKCAWDVVPVVAGKPVWDSGDPIWKEVVRLGKEVGAEAGADWRSFPDLPHFQFLPKASGKPITLDIAESRFKEHGTVFTAA